MLESLRIGFLGAGKMATALAQGFLRAQITVPGRVWASDPFESARRQFADQTGATATESNLEVVTQARVIILSVKPDQVTTVLGGVKDGLTTEHLVVSIAAGVPLAKLEAALGGTARVVRVMPNTPALVGASASGFAIGSRARPEDSAIVERMFSSVGTAMAVKEPLLDAVTGLSGSGPAYVCLMIEALSDGGVAAGLSRDAATRLAAQTLLGTAKMVLETGQHPGVLKDMVTSPGGTTIEGLHELEKGGLRAALINAVRAASEKSKRLGQG